MESFIKIGQTKYVVSIKPRDGELSAGYGPFVVRATSRKNAVAYVKRTWPVSWAKGFEVRPIRRDMASTIA